MKKLLLSLLAVAGAWTSAGAVNWVNDVAPTAGGQSFYLCSVQTGNFLAHTQNKTVDAKEATLFTWRSDNRLITTDETGTYYVELTTRDVKFPTSQPGTSWVVVANIDNGTFRFVKNSDYYRIGLVGEANAGAVGRFSYWLKNKNGYDLENPEARNGNSTPESQWYVISETQYVNHWAVEAYEKAVATYNAKDKSTISEESKAWAEKYLDIDNAADYQNRISVSGLDEEVTPVTELIEAWNANPEKFALIKDNVAYPGISNEVTHVAVERAIKADTWNTLCLPFSMPIPTGWTVMELTGVTYENGAYDAQFTEATSIEAGVPYIVKVENAETEIVYNNNAGFSLSDDISPVQVYTEDNAHSLTFIGVFEPQDLKDCYFISGGKFYHAAAGKGNTTKAYRAIFYTDTPASSAQLIYTVDEGALTLIDAPELIDNSAAPVFDMQGRRVNNPVSGQLYMKNGKKFIQK